jgi:hypothetical protein
MMLGTAQAIVTAMAVYLGIGAAFALAFVVAGATRIDPAARGMPWPARLVIAPGAAALWPLLLAKWLRRREPPVA